VETIEDMGTVKTKLGLVSLDKAAYALHKMGMLSIVLYNIVYERTSDWWFEEDYRDCPCCNGEWAEEFAGEVWADKSYGDGSYEDFYNKSRRDISRDRYYRNVTRHADFGVRGYKSKRTTFKR
jgi:hypothetical protein